MIKPVKPTPLILAVPSRHLDACRTFIESRCDFQLLRDQLILVEEAEVPLFAREPSGFRPLPYEEGVCLQGGGGTLIWLLKQNTRLIAKLWAQGIRWLVIGQLANLGFSMDAELLESLHGDGCVEVVLRTPATQSQLLLYRRTGKHLIIDERRLRSDEGLKLNRSASYVGTGTFWVNLERLLSAYSLNPSQLDAEPTPGFPDLSEKFQKCFLLRETQQHRYTPGLSLWEIMSALELDLTPVEVSEDRLRLAPPPEGG